MHLKDHPEYISSSPHPIQSSSRHSTLSRPNPTFQAAESTINAAYTKLWACPNWPSFRNAAGNADASMPPGGPDRYQDISTELLEFVARDGHAIELKVYRSRTPDENAVLMYRMHGGGWVVGSHEVDGAENVYAATNAGIVVVSVDYRKAPEYPFPQALNDSYDGLLWCKRNAAALGVNPRRVILSGSSAGANLAASLALTLRSAGDTDIIAQVLHFPPVCHPKLFPKDEYEFGSYVQNQDNVVLSAVRMEAFWDAYIPQVEVDWKHSPLLFGELGGLPSTLIQCAGADILRDDAFAYAEALRNSGAATEFYCYAGLPHCFPAILTHLPETSEFYERYDTFLKKCVDRVEDRS